MYKVAVQQTALLCCSTWRMGIGAAGLVLLLLLLMRLLRTRLQCTNNMASSTQFRDLEVLALDL